MHHHGYTCVYLLVSRHGTPSHIAGRTPEPALEYRASAKSLSCIGHRSSKNPSPPLGGLRFEMANNVVNSVMNLCGPLFVHC